MNVKSFKINIPKETLQNLRKRIEKTRWTDEVSGADWDYGTNLSYLKKLLKYWCEKFNWREQEKSLNKFSHFRSKIDSLNIHFIHERGSGENKIPILLLHGFPSSFLQMLKIIPMLTTPEKFGGTSADSFDVVAASLPGYGFSDRLEEKGMTVGKMGEMFAKLMTDELGYEKFAIRASDLGAGVSQQLALSHPEILIGLHHSGTSPYVFQKPEKLSKAEQKFIKETEDFQMREGAYAMLQSTKPQTLAFGLNDSPAGLAAWIVEKFRTWSDCGGNVEKSFSKDEILTNLTIYWATETINSAMRLYYESAHDWSNSNAGKRVETPTAMAMLPADLVHAPHEWHEREYNVTRWTELEKGGHFAEWEVPELIAEDMREFFRPMRGK
jgi:pimeloyl-ACP methyl ester carboxylesterase